MSDLAPELARWVDPGEQVLWSDVARPAILGWPPRSPLGLVLSCLAASALLIGAALGADAWRRVSGLSGWPRLPLLLLAAALGLPLLGLALAWRTRREGRRRYALTRDARGRLRGYTCGARLATRFEVAEPPALEGGERGDLDWGEVELTVLPGGARQPGRARWTDVGYPDVVLDLVRSAPRAG